MGDFLAPEEGDGFAGLARAIIAVHRCVDKNFALTRRSMDRRHKAVEARLKRLEEVLGIDPGRPTPPALWTPRKALGWIATLGTASFFLAKVVNAALPGVIAALHAVWLSAIH